MIRILVSVALFSFALMAASRADMMDGPQLSYSGLLKRNNVFSGNNIFSGINTFSGSSTFLGNNTNSGTSTFSGDAFFKSCRPWADVRAWGAVGDSLTDDTTAIQNAINFCQSTYGSGIVYFPVGNGRYCTFSGITVSGGSPITLLGAGANAVTISACNHDITVVSLNSPYSRIENINIYGRGAVSTDSTSANHPAVSLNGCVGCQLDHNTISGGNFPLSAVNSGDFVSFDNFITNGYGTAVVYLQNTTVYIKRTKVDQAWPGAVPCCGTKTFSAWASTTPYTVDTVVSTSGFYIQCTHAGTSGGSAPTLLAYGGTITDGSAQWKLVGPTTYYGIQMDTASTQIYVEGTDLNGSYTAGLAMTNTLSGTAPTLLSVSDTVTGQIINQGFDLHDGSGFFAHNIQTSGCATTQCGGVVFEANWHGTATIENSMFWQGVYGVLLNAGTNTTISTSLFFANSTAGFFANNSVGNYTFSNNICGSDSAYGGANLTCAQVNGGTGDYYNIVNNVCRGATNCVSDTGSGTHKTETGNVGP